MIKIYCKNGGKIEQVLSEFKATNEEIIFWFSDGSFFTQENPLPSLVHKVNNVLTNSLERMKNAEVYLVDGNIVFNNIKNAKKEIKSPVNVAKDLTKKFASDTVKLTPADGNRVQKGVLLSDPSAKKRAAESEVENSTQETTKKKATK